MYLHCSTAGRWRQDGRRGLQATGCGAPQQQRSSGGQASRGIGPSGASKRRAESQAGGRRKPWEAPKQRIESTTGGQALHSAKKRSTALGLQ